MAHGDPRGGNAALVFVLALVLGGFVVAWSIYDARQRARELAALMDASGAALVEALGHAVEDSLRSALEIEELASNRLLDLARMCERLDRVQSLSNEELDRLADAMGLDVLMILDDRGRTLHANDGSRERLNRQDETLVARLRRLAGGRADYVILGPQSSTDGEPRRFAVAVRRPSGGTLLAAMDASEMLAFQESIGPDHLITAVGTTGGILDAWLEDADGAIVGGSRRGGAEDVPRLEFSRKIRLGDGGPGTLRLGLSGEALRTVRRAGARRTTILGAALFGLALALSLAAVARQRARALRGTAARVRATTDAVLNGMADAVVLLDERSIIRLVNPAAVRLFGATAEELVGRPCGDTWCAALMDEVEGPASSREVMLRPAGADAFPALVSVSRVEVPTMGPVGTAVVLRDLRELRALEAHTRRAESLSALGTLAAAVAHEVRNPLNSISVGVQRLEGEFAPAEAPEDYRRLTRLLRREIERLDSIVDRFLDFAREPRLDTAPQDLDATIRDLMPLLEQSAPDGVTVRFDAGAVGLVRFDPVGLKQVLFNLVRNSIEAVGERGRVIVRTRADGERTRIEVQDDGPGVPSEDRERVFGFGYTTKPAGTGMGLAVVQRMLGEMDGSIDLEPAPGGGTIAVVRLPAEERR